MNSLLIENIEKLVIDSMTIFFEKICDKYENIDIEELKNLWNNNEIEPKKSVTKEKPKSTTKEKNEDGCPYIFSKGQNSGNMCGSKSKTSSKYCSKHQKFEGVEQTKKTETLTKKSNSIADKSSSVKKKSPSVSKKPTERIIKHNKDIDKYWNAETQLVFKSKDDRVVYATFRNDELNELDDDDILLCEQYGFKYDKVALNDEEEEEEEDGAREEKVEKVEKVAPPKKQDIIIEAAAKNKKTLSNAIIENNLKAKCIEDVLNELQLDDEDEDEFVEEVEEEVEEE